MISVLVTGGAGFIGSHLVDSLLGRGDRVTVIDNFNDFYAPAIKRANVQPHLDKARFTLVDADIRDADRVEACFADGRFDLVIHMAAMAGVRPSLADPELYHQVNVMGSLNILEAMRRHQVDRLVFASSSSVYGNNEKVPFAEDDRVDCPISPYAATKRAGEQIVYTYHHLYGIRATCLRFFTVYGPRQRPEMAIHKFTRRIHRGEEIDVYAEGKSQRDYTDVDDIIAGVLAAVDTDLGYEIINLGRSDTVELSKLIGKIEERLDRKTRINLRPSQPGDVSRTFADIDKAKELLGFEPKTSIDRGLDRFIAWYLEKEGDR